MSELETVYKNETDFPELIESDYKKKKKPQKERATWTNGFDFFLSALGYAVGIGNVWRFPYLCYKNGGGVFLIPYFTCMFLIGMPMVYLEFIVGQFTSSGPLTAYKMVKISRGLGLSINMANSFRITFFNMIIAYALYFFVKSFTTELPWQKCDPTWASPNCVDDFSADKFTFTTCNKTETLLKCDIPNTLNFGRCFNRTYVNGSLADCSMNRDLLEQVGYWKTSFPSTDYWRKIVLQQTESINDSGGLVWQLVLSYFGVYLIVYLMLVKGIKVSGKTVYFTALFPYCVLLVLGIRGWILPGAEIGIRFYLMPKWEKLFDIRVWSDAATAIFFSISISFGGMTTLASYNKFNANITRDAITIPLANCLTSFFAGFVIFAYMGYLSHVTGQNIDNIVEAGQGLAFIVYPYAVTTLVGAPVWAILFFFMLILLGVSSQISNIEVTITSLLDAFPILQSTKLRRYTTITTVFLIYFCFGLVFSLRSGTYWVEVFNSYTGDWAILILGATECIVISYLYGLRNFRNDIKAMIGPSFDNSYLCYLWCFLWSILTPLIALVVAITALTKLKNVSIGDYTFPDWTYYFGQIMQFLVLCGLFGTAIFIVIDEMIIKKKRFIDIISPNFDEYLPKQIANQKLVQIQRGHMKESESFINKS